MSKKILDYNEYEYEYNGYKIDNKILKRHKQKMKKKLKNRKNEDEH